MVPILAVLLALPGRAQTAAEAVARAMERVKGIVALERGKDARQIADLDRNAAALGRGLAAWGGGAVEPLAAYARDLKRPAKIRLFATIFLGLTNDPSAYEPLSDLLLDGRQDPDVRSCAAQGLAALKPASEPLRRSLCAALAQPAPPRRLLDDLLTAVARLGCSDPGPLERLARALGPRPHGRDLQTLRRATAALGRSPGADAAGSLLRLLVYFPPRGAARAAVIEALPDHERELVGKLAGASWPVLREALLSETSEPANMVILVRLASTFGETAQTSLLALIDHPDAEVLAETAEALARLHCVRALSGLENTLAGALDDPRFAPKAGRPEPSRLLARIENAASLLRRDARALTTSERPVKLVR